MFGTSGVMKAGHYFQVPVQLAEAGYVAAGLELTKSEALYRTLLRWGLHVTNMVIVRIKSAEDSCAEVFSLLSRMNRRFCPRFYPHFQMHRHGCTSGHLLEMQLETNDVVCTGLSTLNLGLLDWIDKRTGYIAIEFFGKRCGGSL